jgi:hypothetical protein
MFFVHKLCLTHPKGKMLTLETPSPSTRQEMLTGGVLSSFPKSFSKWSLEEV